MGRLGEVYLPHFCIRDEQMKPESQVWIKTREEKLRALLVDEAKAQNMLQEVNDTIRQLKAKSSFRIALINQLIEEDQEENK